MPCVPFKHKWSRRHSNGSSKRTRCSQASGSKSSGLAAAHAIHNGLTTAKGTHPYLHGEKVAFGLLAQLVLEGQPRSVLHRVLTFAIEVGLPITLAEIGLTDLPKEALQKIAIRATAAGETIHNEPFEVQPDMVADALMAADAMGRAWRKDHGVIVRCQTARLRRLTQTLVGQSRCRLLRCLRYLLFTSCNSRARHTSSPRQPPQTQALPDAFLYYPCSIRV